MRGGGEAKEKREKKRKDTRTCCERTESEPTDHRGFLEKQSPRTTGNVNDITTTTTTTTATINDITTTTTTTTTATTTSTTKSSYS